MNASMNWWRVVMTWRDYRENLYRHAEKKEAIDANWHGSSGRSIDLWTMITIIAGFARMREYFRMKAQSSIFHSLGLFARVARIINSRTEFQVLDTSKNIRLEGMHRNTERTPPESENAERLSRGITSRSRKIRNSLERKLLGFARTLNPGKTLWG